MPCYIVFFSSKNYLNSEKNHLKTKQNNFGKFSLKTYCKILEINQNFALYKKIDVQCTRVIW